MMQTDRVIHETSGEENALTPADLCNADLKTNLFGGYSKNQVDTLLERTADALEALITQNRDLKRQTENQKNEIEMFREMEQSLRSALVSSQKMSENIVVSARLQADALLEEARLAKEKAEFRMERLPDALRSEMRRLMEERDRIRDDIAGILKTHENLLREIPRAENTEGKYVVEKSSAHTPSRHDEESPGNEPDKLQEEHKENAAENVAPREDETDGRDAGLHTHGT